MIKFYTYNECYLYYTNIILLSIAITSVAVVWGAVYSFIINDANAMAIQSLALGFVFCFEPLICSRVAYYRNVNARTLYKLAIKNQIKFIETRNNIHYFKVKNTRGKITFSMFSDRISVYKKNMYGNFANYFLTNNYHSRFVLDHLEFLRGDPNESDN